MNKYGEVFKTINPNFKYIMKDLILNDVLNSKSHDEGNYDVDRLDYILRDSLYRGKIIPNYTHEQYKRKWAKVDMQGNIIKNSNGSIVLVSEDTKCPKVPIDVYESQSLEAIEKFLEKRVESYKTIYFSDKTQVSDGLVGNFLRYLMQDNQENIAQELKNFIKHLKEQQTDISIQEYLQWDDIRFYSNCIEVAEKSNNPNLRAYATMIIPNLQALMNLTFSHLDLKNEKDKKLSNLSDLDKEFIKKIHYLITANTELAKALKDKSYYTRNCLLSSNQCCIDTLRQDYEDTLTYANATVYGYKKRIPVFVEDKNGDVYMLNEHPDCSYDWNNRKESASVVYTAIPDLKMKGFEESEIAKIKQIFNQYNKPDKTPKIKATDQSVNMSLIKVDSRMEDYFSI